MSVAVFDIDGVVADVRHRLHHLQGPRKDWDAFFAGAEHDPPLAPGLSLVSDLGAEHDIVWLTGRPERIRSITRDWLLAQDLPAGELHMRGNSDRRPARLYKLGVLRRLSSRPVAAFVDDDAEVIDAAVTAGFAAVLADWVVREPVLRQAQDRLGRT